MKYLFVRLVIIAICLLSVGGAFGNRFELIKGEELCNNDSIANVKGWWSLKSSDSTIISYEPFVKKEFLYDKHTLGNTYPYKDTFRVFQWEKIRQYLLFFDSIQKQEPVLWGILQNKRNENGVALLAKQYRKNAYNNFTDTFGIERTQSAPLYSAEDSVTPERYGLDGMLVKLEKDSSFFIKISTPSFHGNWIVPKKYVKFIEDTVVFTKIIFVDRTNQNIATFEKVAEKWLVRSMNPATTGVHKPPYMQETPIGIFVIQEKKPKMFYTKDGKAHIEGFAPNASRFCKGGYIHGVPVKYPNRTPKEFSATLGTVPRSHMCVRNATSHSKFVYDWAPVNESLVVIFD